MTEWVELNPIERRRTYYKDGELVVSLEDVVRIKVTASGNHYLETKTGYKCIIKPDAWNLISLDTDAWTF